MQCLQCQYENASDAKFCNQCAAPFAPECSTCGRENAADAKFCNQCGTPLMATTSVLRSTQCRQPEAEAESRFHAVLPAVIVTLQRERRVTYRELRHTFGLDDGLLDDIRKALQFKRLATDEEEQGLVWTGDHPLTVYPVTTAPSHSARAESTAMSSSDTPVVSPSVPAMDAGPHGPTTVSETSSLAALAHEPVVSPEPPRVAPEAERRQLTVMFCDLVDSTTLSQQLDAEDLREVIQAYQQTSAEVIQRFDGYIAQHLGDGLLMYFGWPTAHENDAQRALHAALGIVNALTTTLNPRLQVEKGIHLTVRLGVHTGPVVVGEMGSSERHESLATGETVNIAARLEGLAQPNTVVVSAATARLVQQAFALEELGPQRLKGVAERMPVFRVLHPLEVDRDEEATTPIHVSLVGRDEEVGLLLRRWEQAKEGLGQVVLMSGEAGIGKSSLVETLRTQVRHEGYTRIVFRCSPYHLNSALYAVIQHVQRFLDVQPDDTPGARLDKLERALRPYRFVSDEVIPLFANLLSLPLPDGRYPPLRLAPPQQRQQTQDALVAWMLEDAERQPLLAVWEDLHWADPSTLELLGTLIEQTPTVPMLHVLTARPEFVPPWPSRSHLTPMTLNRLERPQVEALITRLAGGKALPAEVVKHVVSKTDGVPLFIEELTKMLLESELVHEQEAHYTLTGPLSAVAIPVTLYDSLMARLDRLPAVREVAQLGAVLGREFAYEMLRALIDVDETTLRDRLAQLVDTELLYQRGRPPHATYIFKHALVQDAAYASLLNRSRQRHHQRAAEVIEAHFPETVATEPELVAHHYTEAGYPEQAMRYWQQAGQRALQRSAYVEAIQALDEALTQLAQLDPSEARDRRELELQVMKLGPLFPVKGYAASECDETSARALTLCRRVDDNETLFPVLYARWAVQYVRGMQGEVFDLSREYLERARAAGADAATVVGYRIHAVALLMRGEVEAARVHARQALERYVPERHQPLIARFGQDLKVQSLNYLALSEALGGRMDTAWGLGEESITHARRLHHIPSLAYTLWHVGVWLPAVIRQTESLHRFGTELIDLCREHRLGFWDALTQAFLRVTGPRTREALGAKEAEQALHVYQHDFHALLTVPQVLCHIADVYVAAGHGAAAHRVLSEAGTLMARHGEVYWEPEVHRLRGHLALMEGGDNAGVAATEFQGALALAQQKGLKLLELRATVSLARLWQSQDKRPDAYDLLAPVYGWFTEGFDTADLQEAKGLLDKLSERQL